MAVRTIGEYGHFVLLSLFEWGTVSVLVWTPRLGEDIALEWLPMSSLLMKQFRSKIVSALLYSAVEVLFQQ